MKQAAALSGDDAAAAGRRKAQWGLHLALMAAVADVSSIDVGVNIRLAWVVLPIAALMVRRSRVDAIWPRMTALLVIVHVIAALASVAPLSSLVYAGWIVFSYVLLFRIGWNAARQLGRGVWDVVIVNGRIQIVVGLLLVVVGAHDRAQFLYYEPSYLSIGLIPYAFAAIYLSRRRRLDIALILILLASNQSANLALILIVAFIAWVVNTGLTWRTVMAVTAIPLVAAFLVFSALSNPANANYAIGKYVMDAGVSWELAQVALERGGNRVPRIEAAWEVAQDYPLLGLGPGNYREYTTTRDFTHITGGLWWLEVSGGPAVNVIVEAVTNAGIAAALIIIWAFLYLLSRAVKCRERDLRRITVGILCATAVTLQFESNYLRAYVWLSFGICAGQLKGKRRRQPGPTTAAVPRVSDTLCARHSMTPRSMNATQTEDHRCGGQGGAAADSG